MTNSMSADPQQREIEERVKAMRDSELKTFLTDTVLRLEAAVNRLEILAGPPENNEGERSAG